jgi:RNA-directed DNA polymerase
MTIPRDRDCVSTKLTRIAELAQEDKRLKFFSIAHHLTGEALDRAFGGLGKEASEGVDGVTYAQYAEDLEGNLQRLHERLKEGRSSGR